MGAITGLLAVLTAIATVNGTVAQMIRNHPTLTISALFLEAFAILTALLALVWPRRNITRYLFTAGALALIAGLICGVWAIVVTFSTSDRPRITASTKFTGTYAIITFHIEAETAVARDQIVVTVWPEGVDGQLQKSVYYSKTGPNESGKLIQDVEITTGTDQVGGVFMTTAVIAERQPTDSVDCDGFILKDGGKHEVRTPGSDPDNRENWKPFRPNGKDPNVACIRIEFPWN